MACSSAAHWPRFPVGCCYHPSKSSVVRSPWSVAKPSTGWRVATDHGPRTTDHGPRTTRVLSLHQSLSLPHFRLHKARTGLIGTSIALGVATLVATRALNDSMTQAVNQSVTPFAGVADLLVSNASGVRASVLRDLQRNPIPGVKHLQPLILE